MKAIGSSSVVLIDGRQIMHTNIAEIKVGMPISVSNLRVHIMTHSDIYDPEKHEFLGRHFATHAKS